MNAGPWLTARILSADRAKLQADAALDVAFVHPDEGESYPVFVPTDDPRRNVR